MLQKKLIQILTRNFYKKNFYIFLLILSSFYFTFYYGYIGIFPIDSFLIYDAGFKLLNGGHPFKDYWSITGPVLDYFQFFFFKVFGINWFSYVLHAATINCLITILLFYFLRQLNVGLTFSFIYSISASILAYPSVGTPFMDHHAVIFSLSSLMYLFLAFRKNETFSWFIVPIFLSASFLSKQIPSAYLLILFIIFIFLYGYLFPQKNYKFILSLIYGSILSILIFLLFLFSNKIPFSNFLTQYILYPLEIGKVRGSQYNFTLSSIVLQFKFIYFSLIPLIFILYKFLGKKINNEVKKDLFLLTFTIFGVVFFIFGQLMTKNQILIFFLIPFCLGVSHHFFKKYYDKKFMTYIFMSILIFSTIKYHLRFNENKKFMELNNVNLNLAAKAENLDNSLTGLKWITPKFAKNPNLEIKNLNKIKNIILSDKTSKIIITDYQILPSILKLKNIAPNKWFDDLSVPDKKNQFFLNYKKFFINKLSSQKIITLYVFDEKKIFIERIFDNNCYDEKKILPNLSKLNIKNCLNYK